jgi:cysteine synthase A
MNVSASARIFDDITQCIGNTPLVRLRRVAAHCAAQVLCKIESFNPLGNIKDRIALAMIEDAEHRGLIHDDTVLIEPTSGNAGIGLAFVCAARGYKLIVTMPESMSIERRRMLKALGAELILTPAADGMPGAVRKAEELVAEHPNYFMPQQFKNPANPEIHRTTTGEEIWRDTAGHVDFVVAGVGTGGTITGVGRALKAHNPNVQVIAVEPANSQVIGQFRRGEELRPGRHNIQGLGAGFLPEVLDLNLLDDVIPVRDEAATEMARRLAAEEGIMAGISSGAAVWAAVSLAKKEVHRGKTVVAILPDLGERYLSARVFPE